MKSGTINGELVTSSESTSVLFSDGIHFIIKDSSGSLSEVFSDPQGLSDGNAIGGVPVELESEKARIVRERFQVGNGRSGSGGVGDQQTKILKAPMPGMVKSVLVEAGTPVKKNSTVVILEAMKMENSITAGVEGIIKKIVAVAGTSLEKNAIICEIGMG